MSWKKALNFTDATFAQFFVSYNVDIHGVAYQSYGASKAKKMRALIPTCWEREPDILVGRVLSEMLDVYEALCDSDGRERDSTSLRRSREIFYGEAVEEDEVKERRRCQASGQGSSSGPQHRQRVLGFAVRVTKHPKAAN